MELSSTSGMHENAWPERVWNWNAAHGKCWMKGEVFCSPSRFYNCQPPPRTGHLTMLENCSRSFKDFVTHRKLQSKDLPHTNHSSALILKMSCPCVPRLLPALGDKWCCVISLGAWEGTSLLYLFVWPRGFQKDHQGCENTTMCTNTSFPILSYSTQINETKTS